MSIHFNKKKSSAIGDALDTFIPMARSVLQNN